MLKFLKYNSLLIFILLIYLMKILMKMIFNKKINNFFQKLIINIIKFFSSLNKNYNYFLFKKQKRILELNIFQF